MAKSERPFRRQSPTLSPAEPLELREKRSSLVAAVLGSFVFVAVAGFLGSRPDANVGERGLLAICGLVFLGFAGIGISRLVRPPLRIRMDQEGISTDAIPGAPPVQIPWRRVTGIRLWHGGAKPAVVIDVEDVDSLFAEASPVGRKLLSANKAIAGSAVTFYPPSYGMSAEEFVENLKVRQDRYA